MTVENLEFDVSVNASNAAKSIDALSTSFRNLKAATNVSAMAKIIDSLRSLNEEIQKLDMSRLTNLANAFNAIGNTVSSNPYNTLTESLKGVDEELKKKPKDALKASTSFKKLSTTTHKTVSAFAKLKSSIGRIAIYRLLRSAIKAITETFKEGSENAYLYSKAVGGDLYTSLTQLSSANYKMTNQLGAAWATLLQTIQPILTYVIQLITSAAETVTKFFAILGGKTTYLKANNYTKEWVDSTSAGAKAAKEWKNQLLGFDEINKLEEPSDTSSSGTDTDYASMFSEVDVGDTAMSRWFSKLKEVTSDWLSTIDFEPIINAWERLKTAVGGFIEIVDGALYWAYTNVLLPLAGWVIEDAAPVVVNLLASAFELLNAVLEKLKPILSTLWEDYFKPFCSFIGDTFCFVIETFTTLFENLSQLISGDISFEEFLDNVGYAGAVAAGVLVGLAAVFVIVNAGTLLTIAAITALVASIGWLYNNWDQVCAAISELWDAFCEWLWKKVQVINGYFELLGQKWQSIKDAISDKIDELKTKFGEIKDKITEFKNNAISAFSSLWTTVSSKVGNIIAKLQSLHQWLQNVISAVGSFFSSGWDRITGWASSAYTYVTGRAEGGFVSSGELFIARENGMPEMVGSIGNQTAVANNDQIVAGISAGVYNAVVSAMGNSKSSGGSVTLNVNGKAFCRAIYSDMKSVTNEHGISLVNA